MSDAGYLGTTEHWKDIAMQARSKLEELQAENERLRKCERLLSLVAETADQYERLAGEARGEKRVIYNHVAEMLRDLSEHRDPHKEN